MNKFKLFLDNFLVYGLGGIINKLIPFFMLPIVTRLMPNSSYFGLSDLSNTLVTFASAFAIMGMYDATFRVFFDKSDASFHKEVCSTSLIFVIFTSAIISIILLILGNQITEIFFGSIEFKILLYLAVITVFIGSTNTVLTIPTRVQNKRITFLSVNFLSSVISYSISIFLLIKEYYLIAFPVAALCSAFTTGISFWLLNKQWFSVKLFNFKLLKQLLKIALPMMPGFFLYWVLGSCDRVMIVNFLGDEAAGLYAAGAKLSAASQLIYMAFAGGWQYFAFSTMNEENQVKNNSLVFEYLGIISFIATSIVCALSYKIFSVFYPESYLSGYIVVPYLFLAPLLLMLYQVISNQFLVIKKTWPGVLIVFTGAVINLLFNYYLIPFLGIEGAGIATLVGYACIVFVCSVVLIKMKLLVIRNKFIVCSVILIFNLIFWRLFSTSNAAYELLLSSFLVIIYVIAYKNDIVNFFGKLRNDK